MAAGTASRFVPLSEEKPKGLLEVKGEILIERQIRQLKEAGISDITVVTGYKSGMFQYLKKYGVDTVMNEDYCRYNNTSSLIRAIDRLKNTFICSSDNYFSENVFLDVPLHSSYSAIYADGPTDEYCLTVDAQDIITGVSIGGHDSWYMVGHVFFSEDFSSAFSALLVREYENEETRLGYWEDVYIKHLNELPPMRMKRYDRKDIEEFDSIDELRVFDRSYISDTRSAVIKQIVRQMSCTEGELSHFSNISHEGDYLLFSFCKNGVTYRYNGADNSIIEL